MHRVHSQDNNLLNTTPGFTIDQLQQLTCTLSQMTPNNIIDTDNAYTNAVSLFSSSNVINYIFPKPWILDRRSTYSITTYFTLFTHTYISPIIKLPIRSSTSITST